MVHPSRRDRTIIRTVDSAPECTEAHRESVRDKGCDKLMALLIEIAVALGAGDVARATRSAIALLAALEAIDGAR